MNGNEMYWIPSRVGKELQERRNDKVAEATWAQFWFLIKIVGCGEVIFYTYKTPIVAFFGVMIVIGMIYSFNRIK